MTCKLRGAAAILIALFLLDHAPGVAKVLVVGGGCSFENALRAAENDAPFPGCTNGFGADTIHLTEDVVLSGSARLVTTTVTIRGHGHRVSTPLNPFFFVQPSGTVSLFDVEVVDANAGAIFNAGSLTVRRSRFTGNANTTRGGAIDNTGTLIVEDSFFHQNVAGEEGGAIAASGGGAAVLVRRSVFTENSVQRDPGASSPHDGGGAIWARDAGVLLVHSSWFDANFVAAGLDAEGGAIRLDRTPSKIEHSTFSNNTGAGRPGGAVYVFTAPAAIYNSTFSGNTTTGSAGGAVYLWANGEESGTIANSTFVDNDANLVSSFYGRGLHFEASDPGLRLTLTNLVVAGPGTQCTTGRPFTNGGGNFGCFGPAVTELDMALADNGGIGPTHALLPGSNAIDAGGAFCGLSTDQRWMARIGSCDSGAFEVSSCADDYFEFEFFGTADNSCTASSGVTTSGIWQSRGLCDRDYLRFTASSSRTYTIETAALTGDTDTTIRAEGGCFGSILGTDDNSGPGLASRLELSGVDGLVAVRVEDASGVYGSPRSYDLRVSCTSGCPCSATDGSELALSNWSITGPVGFQVCRKFSAGSNFTVKSGGLLLLAAGETIVLGDGFSVDNGGSLIAIIDPEFGPDL